ncbi:DUF3093 domain-containing protein [Nocardioides sp. 1609]|uniref:DUF3093 domain-containing protein n=1 Tax=Nocardioides sp. 1609 TaxID=2508327 RepID=UPI001FD70626|nr:DUF3093 domain-containing protein [Nocardioides sp. 1609]
MDADLGATLLPVEAAVGEPAYSERLHVPLRWWVQATMFIATLWLALVVAAPSVVAFAATAVLLAVMTVALRSYGAPQVLVHDGVLRVGRAHIEARHLGAAVALDAEQTRRTAGVEADARAWLVLRPYLSRAVRIQVTDPADPVPYWLVCTRHPEALAHAVNGLAGRAGTRRQ